MSASPHRPPTSSLLSHPSTSASTSVSVSTVHRNRQYAHLHAQLAQLNAHLADMENLVGLTAAQAEYVRGLGGWWGGGFMAASKILGEEAANAANAGSGEKEKGPQK